MEQFLRLKKKTMILLSAVTAEDSTSRKSGNMKGHMGTISFHAIIFSNQCHICDAAKEFLLLDNLQCMEGCDICFGSVVQTKLFACVEK